MSPTAALGPGASVRRLAMLAIVALALALIALAGPAPRADAAELPGSILDGGYIISDAEFFNEDAMDVAQVQAFLNKRVPACAAGATCLRSYTATIKARPADRYCKAVAGTTGLSSARIIVRVAQACGINPRVILVMLQKEQGLVTSTAPPRSRYDRAMGFGCPDTTGCDSKYYGFANQVYLGARQMQVYTLNPNSFNYKPGQVNTVKWHPNSGCGTSKVYIENRATANLYIYTPYRPNVAALAAGYGTGDDCSSYGNRNFYNYYVDWFAPSASDSTGAPAQVPSCQKPASADVTSVSATATVTSTTINVRKAPTLVCSSGMTSLDKGAKVTVTGKYGMWTRAKVGESTAWLATKFLSIAAEAPAGSADPCAQPPAGSIKAASGTVVVTTAALNARTAPSTSCATGRIQLGQGSAYTRTGTYGAWWRISVSGTAYWAHSDYLAVVASDDEAPADPCAAPASVKAASGLYVVRVSTVTARAAPSAACTASTTVLSKGTSVRLIGTTNGWYHMKRGSATFWIKAGTDVFPARERATTTAVNLRAAASTAATSLRLLPASTKVYIVGESGVWRKVIVGSLTGWVHSAYLR